MNLLQRKNLGVFCLLGLALTLSAQAQPYSVGEPIGWPRITSPATRFGNDIPAGATITLQCWSTYDYDWDDCTGSSVPDGATITWAARDAYNHSVGTFIDNQGPTAVWIAPMAVGAVRIYTTADDDPDYLADDEPEIHYLDLDIAKRAYVRYNAPGARTGGNWYDAFTDLQDALALAGAGWEIWVAQGTYYPGASQSATFTIPAGAAVYGGFYGNESLLGERQPSTYVTILSGDIDADGLLDADNCQRVVSMSSGTLDGFTITMGYNDGLGNGAGLGCVGGSPTISGCTFNSNFAAGDGGAVYCDGSSPAFSSCTFSNNEADDSGGAAYYTNSSSGSFNTCTFTNNESVDSAGAVRLRGSSSPTFTACTFSGNVARGTGLLWPIAQQLGMGGALNISDSSPTLNNCTISGNTAYRHGGGIRITGSTCNVTITGGSVTGNAAVCHDGGGIEIQDGAQVTIHSLTVTYNEALFNGAENPDAPPGADTRRGDGGGICIEGTTSVTVTNSTIQYNSCFDDGGGVRHKNGGGWSPDAYTVNNCLYNQPNQIE